MARRERPESAKAARLRRRLRVHMRRMCQALLDGDQERYLELKRSTRAVLTAERDQ